MKNQYCDRFKQILTVISEQGIHTTEELQKPKNEAIYTELWLAAQGFINNYALRSKTHRTSNGDLVEGNSAKLHTLVQFGMDAEDIRENILVHTLSKFDYVLAQPLEKQSNYCYKMVNNSVYDQFRNLPESDVVTVSFQDKVNSSKLSADDIQEYESIIADRSTTEGECMAREAVTAHLKMQRSKLHHELTLLRNNPAEVFVWLCTKHLSMKPRAITQLLLQCGTANAFIHVASIISKEYCISTNALCAAMADGKIPTDQSLKVDTGSSAKISAQISRLSYRACKRFDDSNE